MGLSHDVWRLRARIVLMNFRSLREQRVTGARRTQGSSSAGTARANRSRPRADDGARVGEIAASLNCLNSFIVSSHVPQCVALIGLSRLRICSAQARSQFALAVLSFMRFHPVRSTPHGQRHDRVFTGSVYSATLLVDRRNLDSDPAELCNLESLSRDARYLLTKTLLK
jgi:hypothetical protein